MSVRVFRCLSVDLTALSRSGLRASVRSASVHSHEYCRSSTLATHRNRAYRLWCARNPNFEKRGRLVSILSATNDFDRNLLTSCAAYSGSFAGLCTRRRYSVKSTHACPPTLILIHRPRGEAENGQERVSLRYPVSR